MSKSRASLLMIVITCLTVTGLAVLPSEEGVAVHTTVVQRGDLLQTVLLTGVVDYAQRQTCVSLRDGVIRTVHVQPGQQVQEGTLLFTLDTAAEEAALAALLQARQAHDSAMHQLDSAAAVLAQNAQTQWMERESQLRNAIAAAQIRAGMDGVVENVYVREGGTVRSMTLLGTIHGMEECITVTARAADAAGAETGAPAVAVRNGEVFAAAVLEQLHAPEPVQSTGQMTQSMTFRLMEKNVFNVGEEVTVELLHQNIEDTALIPLAAVSHGRQVWTVENGRAVPVLINVDMRNETYVAAPAEWDGKRIILQPDERKLTPGCPVKEAKAE